MSWIDRIQDDLTITTGDGKQYTPDYINAEYAEDFNTSEFNFVGIAGTLIDRREVQGRRFNLEIYFQGADHLDDAEAFRVSANDRRPWTMNHPMYGELKVQPFSLKFDNKQQNITKITGVIGETITEDGVQAFTSPVDDIEEAFEEVNTASATAFETTVTPTATDQTQMASNTTSAYNQGAKAVTDNEDAQNYLNSYNKALSSIDTATSQPLAAINAIQNVLVAPARFQQSARSRLNLLKEQFDTLRTTLENVLTPNEKRLYQNNSTSIVNATVLAVSTPQDGDYTNAPQVLAVQTEVADMFDQYIEDLDSLQTENGGGEESYIPDPEPVSGLTNLVNYALANLQQIALESAQERSIFCEEDTNLVLLTHRLYGPQNFEENLQYLKDTNNIGISELLGVRKGREIVYYV